MTTKTLDVAAHPLMLSVMQQVEMDRTGFEQHVNHRIAAAEATIREEYHRSEKGHVVVNADGGTCAVCGEIVHPTTGKE